MNKGVGISAIVILAIALGAGAWHWGKTNSTKTEAGQQPPIQKQVLSKIGAIDDLLAQAKEMKLPNVDTTGWQKYQDEKIGIEFMYPGGGR